MSTILLYHLNILTYFFIHHFYSHPHASVALNLFLKCVLYQYLKCKYIERKYDRQLTGARVLELKLADCNPISAAYQLGQFGQAT